MKGTSSYVVSTIWGLILLFVNNSDWKGFCKSQEFNVVSVKIPLFPSMKLQVPVIWTTHNIHEHFMCTNLSVTTVIQKSYQGAILMVSWRKKIITMEIYKDHIHLTLATLIVCCSIASCILPLSCSRMLLNSSCKTKQKSLFKFFISW